MIKKAAAGYVGWLCANGIVAPEKNKIYAYGMELVLSGLVNVCAMKAMVERIFQWFGGVVAVLARRTATASVNSTCFYTAYQPDVPENI